MCLGSLSSGGSLGWFTAVSCAADGSGPSDRSSSGTEPSELSSESYSSVMVLCVRYSRVDTPVHSKRQSLATLLGCLLRLSLCAVVQRFQRFQRVLFKTTLQARLYSNHNQGRSKCTVCVSWRRRSKFCKERPDQILTKGSL